MMCSTFPFFFLLSAAFLAAQHGEDGDGISLTLLIRPGSLDAQQASAWLSDLEINIKGAPGVSIGRPNQREDEQERMDRSRRAQSLFQQAFESYHRFENQEALRLLEESRLAQGQECSGDIAWLHDQRLLQALIWFAMGERDRSMQAFVQLAVAEPDWEADPRELAPKIVALAAQAKQTASALPSGSLSLAGWPKKAAVLLDGRPQGELDLRISDIGPGRHCLQIQSPDREAYIQAIDIGAASDLSVTVVLLPKSLGAWMRQKSKGGDLDPFPDLEHLDTTFVAVGEFRDQEVSVRLVSLPAKDANTGFPCRYSLVEPGAAKKLASCIIDGIFQLRKAPPPQPLASAPIQESGFDGAALPLPLPAKTPVSAQTPWYRQWWFWSTVGGTAALSLGLGLALYFNSQHEPSGVRLILTRP